MENCVRHPPSDPHCDILLKLGHKILLRNRTTPQKQHFKQLLTAPKTVFKRTFTSPKNSNFFLLIEPVLIEFFN